MLLAQPTPAHPPGVVYHDLFRKPWQTQAPVNGHYSLPASRASMERPISRFKNSVTPVLSTSQSSTMVNSDLGSATRSINETKDCIAPSTESTRPRRATESAFTSRHATRSKTAFRLALPPPRQKHSLRLRPKLLLQVQQISHTTRPVPKLDVLPSAFFGTLFGLKAHCMLNVKFSRCGPADVVVVPSDSYSTLTSEDDGGHTPVDEPEHRELVSAITMPRKEDRGSGAGEICLAHGSRWDAFSLPNGNYEFVNTSNGVRTVARWVLRRNRRSTVAAEPTNNDSQKSFTFSLIDPSTRRHPVIGWLNSKGVDVADRYCPTPEPAAKNSDIPEVDSDDQLEQPRQGSRERKILVEMDDFLRTLIVVSSIYVSLREGWTRNEISSSLESSTVNATPLSSRLPSPSHAAFQSTDLPRDGPPKLRRRRSSQFSSFFERTSNVFRRSLSVRSSRPPSIRRTLETSYPSRVSSRRSSLLSDAPNKSELRDSAFQQRFATMPTARPRSGNRSLLTEADTAGFGSVGDDAVDEESSMSLDRDEDSLDNQEVVASSTHMPRACSPSPDPSGRSGPTPLFIKGGPRVAPTSRNRRKWRKFSHWLKPSGNKKDKGF